MQHGMILQLCGATTLIYVFSAASLATSRETVPRGTMVVAQVLEVRKDVQRARMVVVRREIVARLRLHRKGFFPTLSNFNSF